MNAIGRATLCLGLLACGVAAQAALEDLSEIERPPLRRPLASLPRSLGTWNGVDLAINADVLRESQATEVISRSYESPKYPGIKLTLWVNYSLHGNNMRHSPEVCLPSNGWSKVEAHSRVVPIPGPGGKDEPVTRLGYSKAELVQAIGFWYYIYGEGPIERWVRGLPITSRSSHGRTTRGSGLTVEVFWNSNGDAELPAFRDFSAALLAGLDPIMPLARAEYYVP